VEFLTLLERKVLGCIHIRKDPNKVGFVGIFSRLEMLLSYLPGSSIFLQFLIILFIIFLLFLVFSFFVGMTAKKFSV
jgi:NADH:ubiquinone oxidoreductase subunit H